MERSSVVTRDERISCFISMVGTLLVLGQLDRIIDIKHNSIGEVYSKRIIIVKMYLNNTYRTYKAYINKSNSYNVGDKRVGQTSESDTPKHTKKPIFDV
jgi:hypothetical protein